MKKICFLLTLLMMSINVFSQNEKVLKDYLANNAASLNPIEGVYDVEWTCDYITPFVHQKYEPETFTIIIVKNSEGSFDVYASQRNYAISPFLKITQIGQTNVYYFYYYTSKCRIYLTDNNRHFVAQLHLDNYSAKKFTGNSRTAPSVNVYPVYDCIKTFPTY